MSRIRSSGTKPELRVIDVCREIRSETGHAFYINYKGLLGKPDVFFRKRKLAIFVHGCFWHRHSCSNGQKVPRTNPEFWEKKRGQNTKRDEFVRNELMKQGYDVHVVWECETKDATLVKKTLLKWLRSTR